MESDACLKDLRCNYILIRVMTHLNCCKKKFYRRAREIGSWSTKPGTAILDKGCLCLLPSGLCPRRMSNSVLQANLLYLYFSIPLSPLTPFLCVFVESLYLLCVLNAQRSASYKARASVLSRGSLGYRGTSGPDVHTETHVKITLNLTKTNDATKTA